MESIGTEPVNQSTVLFSLNKLLYVFPIKYFSDFAYIISGPFIWRMRMTSDGWEPFDNYPKRVTDVFQQTYGAVEALFKTESGDSITVFALFGGDMISKYRIIPRDGNAEPIVILLDAKTKRRDFLSKQSILIDENIRSAFTYNDKTILVADNLEQYYEVCQILADMSLSLFSIREVAKRSAN